ncbi:hypothetical protein JOD67_000246 [Tenggerimyces flavus]|nr:hypothetical protein [Tenggerimyces flavus]
MSTGQAPRSDPVLDALREARAVRDGADEAIRVLLAWAREVSSPRPYRLADLADASGLSISGVRSAYGPEDVELVRTLLQVGELPAERAVTSAQEVVR